LLILIVIPSSAARVWERTFREHKSNSSKSKTLQYLIV
jgi:hypothetical protein